MSSIDVIQKVLSDPPDSYRPYPFWFWNGRLTREEITWQLEECLRKHITAVLVHPRYGLVTDYMGPEYMDMIVHTVRECERLGMKVWLYDEYNWPSGTVAGRLLRDCPQYRMKMLRYEFCEVDGPAVWHPEEQPNAELYLVQGCDMDSGKVREFSLNTTGEVSLPAGRWAVAAFYMAEAPLELCCVRGHGGAAQEKGYLDTMDADAVGEFMQRTHEVYHKHLKDYFGNVVVGMFTDEPGIIYDFDFGYDMPAAMSSHLPWTRSMEEQFTQRAGYSIRDRLIHLIADVPDADATRTDYWSTVTALYCENYHDKMSSWCEDRGIAYTGHNVLEEEYLHYQGDLAPSLAPMHVPGLDWTSRECSLDTAHVYRTAKMAASIAHKMKRSHVMCETFGASAGDLTPADMRRVTDYLYATGVNLICLHGFFYNVGGSRAYECPPSEFFQNPWWEHMAVYSDYTARLGALLSQGKHMPGAGVLIPSQSFQVRNERTFMSPGNSHRSDFDYLQQLLGVLLEIGVDYECVCDSLLIDTEITSSGIAWGDEYIDMLIIPPVDVISLEVWNRIKAFADAGGEILLLGKTPSIQGGDVDAASAAGVMGSPMCGQLDAIRPALSEALSGRRVDVKDDGAESGGLIVYRRQLDDSSVLCFVYEAQGLARGACELRVPGRFSVQEIDVDKANIASVAFAADEEHTCIRASFRANEGRLFLLSAQSSVDECRPVIPAEPKSIIELDRTWDFEPDRLNVLKIQEMLTIGAPDGNGAEANLHIHCDTVPTKAHLLLEGESCSDVHVNRKNVSDRKQAYRYFDSDQYAIDISDCLQPGLNRIAMQYHPAMEDEVISPLCAIGGITCIKPHVYLIGQFGVAEDHHIISQPTALNLGGWESQGFPHLAGIGIYRTTLAIEANEPFTRAELHFDVAESSAEVIVNGKPCGVRSWAPYSVDITDALQAGSNAIEIRVCNTVANLLAPLKAESDMDNPIAWLTRMHGSTRPSGLQAARVELFL